MNLSQQTRVKMLSFCIWSVEKIVLDQLKKNIFHRNKPINVGINKHDCYDEHQAILIWSEFLKFYINSQNAVYE